MTSPSTTADFVDRRRSDSDGQPRLQAAIALTFGGLLLLPSVVWATSLLWTVATTDASSRILYLLGLPLFVAGCGALLCYFGVCSLRDIVPALDRRNSD